jgi:hypothetical protein
VEAFVFDIQSNTAEFWNFFDKENYCTNKRLDKLVPPDPGFVKVNTDGAFNDEHLFHCPRSWWRSPGCWFWLP